MRSPYLHVIYCDDVLQQTNGKTSLIGCYGDVMLVGAFPHTHPKLCFQINLNIPPPKEDISVQLNVLMGEDILMESRVNISLQSDPPENMGLLVFNLSVAVEGHQFTGPTVLRVTAQAPGMDLESQTLSVNIGEDQQTD